jgi:hypothetical protein
VGNKLEKEGDLWPVFKTLDFAPDFPCRERVYLSYDLISFLCTIGSPWKISPVKDILSYDFGNLAFGHFLLPGCQVHMRFQINAFPVQVPSSPSVF